MEAASQYTGASSTFTSAESLRIITADFNASSESSGTFASWSIGNHKNLPLLGVG